MFNPKVSVVIPAYKQAQFLGEAIQSVLDQTYEKFELIVVDDASPDNTEEVVRRFTDPRIKYIIHHENRGLPAARNTGIRASSGELLAFLDSDDRYDPEKLESLVKFLDLRPGVGLVYHSRIIIDSRGQCQFIQRSPTDVRLKDLILGFPFTINDLVMQREWAFKIGLFDESYYLNSEDLDFYLRLALQGCKFSGIGLPLSYRRVYSDRKFKHLAEKLSTCLRALNTVFQNPDCPTELLALQNLAFANHYLSSAYLASIQDERCLANDWFKHVIKLDPTFVQDEGRRLIRFLIHTSIMDGGEHEPRLKKVFACFPDEIKQLRNRCNWTIAQGYLIRGLRDMIWGRTIRADENLTKAIEMRASIDQYVLTMLVDQLVGLQDELGSDGVRMVIQNLSPYFGKLGMASRIRWLKGVCSFHQSLNDFYTEQYREVPIKIFRAIYWNPEYLKNKGVFSILIHSLVKSCVNRSRVK